MILSISEIVRPALKLQLCEYLFLGGFDLFSLAWIRGRGETLTNGSLKTNIRVSRCFREWVPELCDMRISMVFYDHRPKMKGELL